MKRITTLAILLGLLLAVPAFAQTGTLTQQSATRLDAATICGTAATTGATVTFTVPAGQSFYVTEVDIQNTADATGVTAAAQTTLATTGLTGTPTWEMASGTTAGGSVQNISVQYPTGLKGQSNTNVVFTLPTFATHQVIRINVCGYFGT